MVELHPIFFSHEDSYTKGLLDLLYVGLESVPKIEINLKRKFLSFTVTPSNGKVLWARALLGHNTKEELARGHFFEGLQNYLEKKNERNENKIILRDFICTMDKMDWDSGNTNHVIPIMSCKNSSWIMGSRIYGEERTEIPLSSPTTLDSLAQDPGKTGYTMI